MTCNLGITYDVITSEILDLFCYLNNESVSRTSNPLSLNILNIDMISALKSFQIYANLFLAVHIANVSRLALSSLML